MSKGIVYILTNNAMPGIIKIGITTNLKARMSQLDTTGVPLPFKCHYAVEVEDYENKEKGIHDAFSDNRIRPNREFFKLSPEKAVAILKIIGGKEIKTEDEMIDQDGNTLETTPKLEKEFRGKFTFKEVNIPKGSELIFSRTFPNDEEKKCTVADDQRAVMYEGKIYSLSSLALKLIHELGYKWKTIQGPAFWKYEDELLIDRRDRIEEENEEQNACNF